MKRIVKKFGICLVVLLTLIIILIGVLLNNAFIPIKTKSYQLPVQKYTNWDEIFANPQNITVQQFNTGIAMVNLRGFLTEDSPNKNMIPEGITAITVAAYWVHHSEKGDILIDTGLNASFRKKSLGDYALFMKMMSLFFSLEMKQKEGEDFASRLKQFGIKPGTVLLTHLHPDHITGLPLLSHDIEVVMGKNELTFMAKAGGGHYLKNMTNLKTLDFSKGIPIAPFDSVIDIFGDGSLWAISTPGHSKDHISFLVNSIHDPVFVLGDALALRLLLKYDFEFSDAGTSKEDYVKAIDTLEKIRQFVKKYPDMKLLFSHDLANENE